MEISPFKAETRDGINYWHIPDWTDQGLSHGWTDRTLNGSVDCKAFAGSFGFERLVKLKQVHATEIIKAQKPLLDSPIKIERDWLDDDAWPRADGWIIDGVAMAGSKTAFFIRTADCFPVIVADCSMGFALNLHCGWQGTIEGLLPKGIELLKTRGSKPEDLQIGIGPGIRPCCFEIQTEVAEKVRFAGLDCGVNAVEMDSSGKSCGDLPSILKGQARSFGIPDEIIFELPICTACNHRFFSYRRNPKDPGRQVTFFGVS